MREPVRGKRGSIAHWATGGGGWAFAAAGCLNISRLIFIPIFKLFATSGSGVWRGRRERRSSFAVQALFLLQLAITLAVFVQHSLSFLFVPLLPAIAIVFRSLDALRVFDVIYVLTGDNPSTASMSVYARQQLIDFQQGGMGSAAATFLFLIVAVFATIVVTAGRLRIGGVTR